MFQVTQAAGTSSVKRPPDSMSHIHVMSMNSPCPSRSLEQTRNVSSCCQASMLNVNLARALACRHTISNELSGTAQGARGESEVNTAMVSVGTDMVPKLRDNNKIPTYVLAMLFMSRLM